MSDLVGHAIGLEQLSHLIRNGRIKQLQYGFGENCAVGAKALRERIAAEQGDGRNDIALADEVMRILDAPGEGDLRRLVGSHERLRNQRDGLRRLLDQANNKIQEIRIITTTT